MSNFTVASPYTSGGQVTHDNLNALVTEATPTLDFVNGLDAGAFSSALQVVASTGPTPADTLVRVDSNDLLTLSQVVGADTGSNDLNTSKLSLGQSSGTNGNGNTFLGPRAGMNAVSAEYNVTVGNQAGKGISDGDYNVGVGANSLWGVGTGSQNTAVGYRALKSTSNADNNTAVGSQAGSAVQGTGNVAVGSQSMLAGSGDYNIAIGHQCLAAADLGASTQNVAVGAAALLALESSNYNVAIGGGALEQGESQNNNVAVGYQAGRGSGGADNVFLGHNTNSPGSPSQSVAVGKNATCVSFTNSVAIGYGATCNQSNQIVLGTSSHTEVILPAALPTTDPGVAGQLWSQAIVEYGNVLTISAG